MSFMFPALIQCDLDVKDKGLKIPFSPEAVSLNAFSDLDVRDKGRSNSSSGKKH